MNKKLTVYQQAKRLLGEIMDAKYGTKNRSLLILRLHELIETLLKQEKKRGNLTSSE